MPINIFDAVVYVAAIVAIVTGFSAGFVRSVATILGYLAAAPIAFGITSMLAPELADRMVAAPNATANAHWAQNLLLLVGIFLIAGVVLAQLLRLVIDETFGPSVGILDRAAGALLGATRVGLIAITVVLIFDRIIPANRQPEFLIGSKLRPPLSVVAQVGVKSLPPEIISVIDRLKRERGI